MACLTHIGYEFDSVDFEIGKPDAPWAFKSAWEGENLRRSCLLRWFRLLLVPLSPVVRPLSSAPLRALLRVFERLSPSSTCLYLLRSSFPPVSSNAKV